MKSISPEMKNEVFRRKDQLECTKIQLKKEFVGLDRVIDDLIESVSYWYYFPDLQKKPVVVNLWGLTGVGKTSLVNRLVALLSYSEHFYPFNLSENDWDIKRTISELYDKQSDQNFILLFDEFQNVRTITEDGTEKRNFYPYLWEMLDTGKIPTFNYNYRLNELNDLEAKLKKMLQLGIRVKDGLVIEYQAIFKDETELQINHGRRRRPNSEKSELFFVPEEFHETIFELYRDKFAVFSDVRNELKKMDGRQTIEFIRKVMIHAMAAKYLDCTKSLIFIVGNLDEAYQMTRNFDTDISADEFHEQSLRITLPKIKSALKKRFRSEQISRLGNNHIIYPAFDKKTFEKLILLELQKTKDETAFRFGIQLEFTESVTRLIYNEGVYPTQGTRPLFSSIHQIINTQVPKIVYHLLQLNEPIETVQIDYESRQLNFKFYADQQVQYEFQERILLRLEKLRRNKKDEIQAICAVHESGHAIVSAILLKCIPESVYSATTSSDNRGFVFTKMRWDYLSKGEMRNRVAALLGGYAAEKIIFGEENLTNGSESDIQKATNMVCDLLKNCGFDIFPAAFQSEHPDTNLFLTDEDGILNKKAQEIIISGLRLAVQTLNEQKRLLLKMSEYLAENRSMQKDLILQFITNHVVNFNLSEIEKSGGSSLYRNLLKQQLNTVETKADEFVSQIEGIGYSLNSKQKEIN
jgi:cell division protease FtsH